MKRLSPTTVIALLALFFSLVGTGFAVNHYIITSKSQIKPSVLKQLKGNRGVKGVQGIPGVAGPIGSPGSQGLQGSQGNQGAQGSAGSEGDQGIQGPIGLSGPQGVKGDTGTKGNEGEKGDPGVQGSKGAEGPAGPPGAISSTSEWHVVTGFHHTAIGEVLQADMQCPEGFGKLTGGGVRIEGTGTPPEAQVGNVSSYPIGNNTWRVRAIATSEGNIAVEPFAICVQ